jgi:hypothetical protein
MMVGVPKRDDNYLKDSKHGFFLWQILTIWQPKNQSSRIQQKDF